MASKNVVFMHMLGDAVTVFRQEVDAVPMLSPKGLWSGAYSAAVFSAME